MDRKDSLKTYGELLEYALETVPDADDTLFQLADEDVPVSFSEFNSNVNRMCNMLLDWGVQKGDHVAVFLGNCFEYPHLFLTLGRMGAVVVPINPFLRGEPLRYILNHSDSRYLITSKELFSDKVGFVADSLEKVEQMLFIDEEVEDSRFETGLFAKWREYPAEFELPWQVAAEDVEGIWYTSGTTGLPKGSVISQECYLNRAIFFSDYFRLTPSDVIYYILPMYHIAYPVWGILLALAAKCKIVNVRWFSASKFWKQITGHKATVTFSTGTVIPIMLNQEVTQAEIRGRGQLRLWVGWPVDDPQAVRSRWPKVKFIEAYGTTEYPIASICSYDDPEIGSAGPVTPYTQMKLLDPERGEELPSGKVGEIVVKHKQSPNLMIREYYKDPEKTGQTIRDGWWHSGDLGYLDERGCLHFVDRAKDYVRIAGENVSSVVVESLIRKNPRVQEVAVVAVKSELGHDEIVAHVVPKAGQTLTPEEFFRFCNENMAYFMVPRYLYLREELPKTATSRVEKYRLKEEAVPPGSYDRVSLGIKIRR